MSSFVVGFYPEPLRSVHSVTGVAEHLDWTVVEPRRVHEGLSALFVWHYASHTWLDGHASQLPVVQRVLNSGVPVVNAELSSIDKSFIDSVFRTVFGYGLLVNPLRWSTLLVEKSADNYRHDGIVLPGPLPPDQVSDKKVYCRLVESRAPDGGVMDLRVSVTDRRVTWVIQYWKTESARFESAGHAYNALSLDPTVAFSEYELTLLSRFCARMALDFGDLDVLRDVSDGRIYVVDVNPTAGGYLALFGDLDRAFPMMEPRYRSNFLQVQCDALLRFVPAIAEMVSCPLR